MSTYAAVGLPWSHGIGTKVKECTSAREVMEKAGLNFHVEKCELYAQMPFSINGNNDVNGINGDFAYDGNIYRSCPNGYATYRTDKNVPLGVVKSKYEVVQNIDAFEFFDDAIGPGKALWQYAGLFGVGERVYISAKLPITTTVKGEPIENYLVFSNSHDGSMSINILFTPIRMYCINCLNSAIRSADSYIRLRHTKTVKERLDRGSEVLRIACEHANDSQQLYEALASVKMTDDAVVKYLSQLTLTEQELNALIEFDNKLGFNKLLARDYLTMERTGISTRKANMIANMFDYYQNGVAQQSIVGTPWGAYNAVTGYYSNVANLDGQKRMDSLLYGGASIATNKALNIAFDYYKEVA